MQRAANHVFGCAAIAGILLLASGSAALGQQKYPDMQGPRALNAGEAYQGGYTVYNNGKWNGRVDGGWGPDSGRPDFGRFSAPVAREQLNAKGYTHVHGLKPEHGWSAQAVKNGQQVKVLLDDKNDVATYWGK